MKEKRWHKIIEECRADPEKFLTTFFTKTDKSCSTQYEPLRRLGKRHVISVDCTKGEDATTILFVRTRPDRPDQFFIDECITLEDNRETLS